VNVTLSLASDKLLGQEWGLEISPHHRIWRLLVQRTGSLLSSGIYHKLEEMKKWSVKTFNNKKVEQSTEPTPLNLSTNILTIFAIYLVGLGIAVLFIIIEILYFYSYSFSPEPESPVQTRVEETLERFGYKPFSYIGF